jgi:hypothetical protein
MTKDYIGYQALTDTALRSVVREALRRVEKQGLLAGHHFYITFKTKFPGVEIPDFLAEQYPDEMTIVLQHQYWGLKAHDDRFEVTLTFRKVPAELSIPFAALTTFFDPGVQFGLQFKNGEDGEAAPVQMTAPPGVPEARPPEKPAENKQDDAAPQSQGDKDTPAAAPGEVVNLDSFRKK